MKNSLPSWLYFCTFTLLLNACTMNQATQHKAMCNRLKSQIVFNGATSNSRQAEIEEAEQPLQQSNYHSNDCDQI